MRQFISFNLRAKLIIPYVILALFVTLIAAIIVSRVLLSSWTERFNNQLITAAEEAADVVVRQEEIQLAAWRQIAFTQGVADAALANDVDSLTELVEPIVLNNRLSQVIILTALGKQMAALSGDGRAPADTDYTTWNLVQQTRSDNINRYAGLQADGSETIFYTAGAITTDESQFAGILLIGTPLDQLATTLSESVLAGVTLYGPEGQLLATTVGQADTAALGLTSSLAGEVLARQGHEVHIRTINPAGNEFAQLLTPFKLGAGEDVGLLGASLRTNLLASPLYPARQAVTLVFTTAIAATLVIGFVLASQIVRPIERLMAASRRVADGDLGVQVPAKSADEIGQLSQKFNEMVRQLRQRRKIEDLFGRYVGDNIASRLLAGEAELGGQRVFATVLFADIRDFTAFTEKADLTDLIEELNEYYATMQRVIDEHGGVVNKFGGDSILALFGTPLPLENHAQQAVAAAVDMMDQLAGLNDNRLARGDLPFRIGIGVNSGEMVVGNLGSDKRREFTVLGDSVNTAKRLSDLNKDTPIHSIFISGETMRELDTLASWRLDDLGMVTVKGKETPVTVYALMQAGELVAIA